MLRFTEGSRDTNMNNKIVDLNNLFDQIYTESNVNY